MIKKKLYTDKCTMSIIYIFLGILGIFLLFFTFRKLNTWLGNISEKEKQTNFMWAYFKTVSDHPHDMPTSHYNNPHDSHFKKKK